MWLTKSTTLALITLDHGKNFQNGMKSIKPLGPEGVLLFDGTNFW